MRPQNKLNKGDFYMAYGIKNVVKIDPLAYNIGLIGESGIGKTTIIRKCVKNLRVQMMVICFWNVARKMVQTNSRY